MKGLKMEYDNKTNVRLDEFNKLMMDFVLTYGCQLSVIKTWDGPYDYRLSQKDKWAVLFNIHPSGIVLKVDYNFRADACNYDIYYDIEKSVDLYRIGNYEQIINKVRTLMAKNFIYPVKKQ